MPPPAASSQSVISDCDCFAIPLPQECQATCQAILDQIAAAKLAIAQGGLGGIVPAPMGMEMGTNLNALLDTVITHNGVDLSGLFEVTERLIAMNKPDLALQLSQSLTTNVFSGMNPAEISGAFVHNLNLQASIYEAKHDLANAANIRSVAGFISQLNH